MVATDGDRARTRDPEQIERDIEHTRSELAATIAAVAEKADVKSRAKHRVDEAKAQARQNRTPLAIGGAIALLALILWAIRR